MEIVIRLSSERQLDSLLILIDKSINDCRLAALQMIVKWNANDLPRP